MSRQALHYLWSNPITIMNRIPALHSLYGRTQLYRGVVAGEDNNDVQVDGDLHLLSAHIG